MEEPDRNSDGPTGFRRSIQSTMDGCLHEWFFQPAEPTPESMSEDQVYKSEHGLSSASCTASRSKDSSMHLAVSFSGGGVRSQAFCCGVLWALAEAERLQDVTHLSSVSGGSVAASSYASFLVSKEEPSDNPKRWYLEVIADLIECCQWKAGYLVQFRQPHQASVPGCHTSTTPCDSAPTSSGSPSWRSRGLTGLYQRLTREWLCMATADLFLLFMVVVGVLLAAPAIFVVYYVVPISLVLEAYWGGTLRAVFCRHQIGQSLEELAGAMSPQLVVVVILACVALLVQLVGNSCLRLTDTVRSVRRHRLDTDQRVETRRHDNYFLCLGSLKALLCRWLVFLVLLCGALLLVYAAQEQWASKSDQRDHQCRAYMQGSAFRCSDFRSEYNRRDSRPWYCGGVNISASLKAKCDRTRRLMQISHPARESAFLQKFKKDSGSMARNEPQVSADSNKGGDTEDAGEHDLSLFAGVFLALILWGIVGSAAAFLGSPFILYAFAAVFLPLWFLLMASFVLQWIAFGPITAQPLILINRMRLPGPHSSHYADGVWTAFSVCFLVLAILALPFFNKLHRFVHHYFRVRLQRAFYKDGADVPMAKIAATPHIPVLLFGATLTDFQRPQDVDAHSMFVLSQHHVGCERTSYISAPSTLTLSKCMSVSCAAIDAFVLTQVNTWHSRILLALLNLTQGDWMRFNNGRNWRSLTSSCCPQYSSPALDRLPEFVLWSIMYLCLVCAQVGRFADSADACRGFWFFNGMASALFISFIGVFSFFPHCKWVAWLSASPLVRQIHMFLMKNTVAIEPPMFLYLTDGGPIEDLGIVQLLRRHCRWILSVDAGDDPEGKLLDLHTAIALARKEKICSFFDPTDARHDLEQVLEAFSRGNSPFLHLGVLYNDRDGCSHSGEVGDIFLIRMRIYEEDDELVQPLIAREEISGGSAAASRADCQVPEALSDWPRRRLNGICCDCCHSWCCCGPNFPNTHTANQFFTPLMWANFCRLGHGFAGPTIAKLSEAQRMSRTLA